MGTNTDMLIMTTMFELHLYNWFNIRYIHIFPDHSFATNGYFRNAHPFSKTALI